MSKNESPLSVLRTYIPEQSLEDVIDYLQQYKVHLTITRERKTILGNYRSSHPGANHRITVNGNLNKYSFLITLLHELAHLLTFEKYGRKALPHGAHWKSEFGNILSGFLQKKIFPADIEMILSGNLDNLAASSCVDIPLTRVLRNYDDKKDGVVFVEELPAGTLFKIKGGKIFEKGEKIKKRFKCKEVSTGKYYLFSPVYDVEKA